MLEQIQKHSDEVSLIIYDPPLPPKYFRVKKKTVHMFFSAIPIVTVLLISIFFMWGIGVRLKTSAPNQLTQVLSQSGSSSTNLEAELDELKKINKTLTDKISSPQDTSQDNQEAPFLMMIKKPYGMQNLISENRITLDQFEFIASPGKVNLKFQIISTNPETKVTGHILVFMVSSSSIMTYPLSNLNDQIEGIKFSIGEPFAVSRLRPTNAEFLYTSKETDVRFVIYIFSKEGDLLQIKQTESFKIEAK
jgi:hypothetical protein